MPLVLDPIVTALKDDDDDVRAVAASALLPVAESLVMFAPNHVSNGKMLLEKPWSGEERKAKGMERRAIL